MIVIGVMAGKGGVGKSTVAVNLAHALVRKGQKVALLDADLYGPSLKQMLNVNSEPVSREGKIVPVEIDGLGVISLALFKQGDQNNAVRAPIANSIIKQFIHEVDWEGFDYLVVDFPPGTGDIPLTLMQELSFDGAVLVSTPQKVAVLDVMKAKQMCELMEVPILGVVENMSHFQGNPIFGKGNLDKLGLRILAQVPLDPELARSMDEGIAYESDYFDRLVEGVREKIGVQINQPDGYTVELTFSNGKKKAYRLSELQKMCPCIRCKGNSPKVDPEVSALGIERIGHYAMKIQFSTGCSKGLYTL